LGLHMGRITWTKPRCSRRGNLQYAGKSLSAERGSETSGTDHPPTTLPVVEAF
jgi:hypothetical protein